MQHLIRTGDHRRSDDRETKDSASVSY